MNLEKYFLIAATFLIKISLLNAQEPQSRIFDFHRNSNVHNLIAPAIKAYAQAHNEKNYSIQMGKKLIYDRDYISNLPPEILHMIIGYVPYEDRIINLRAVSKQFKATEAGVGINTIRLATNELYTSDIADFVVTLKLRENTKRALKFLKGRTHTVKHLIIHSYGAQAFPLEAHCFEALEKITFDTPTRIAINKSDINHAMWHTAYNFTTSANIMVAEQYDIAFLYANLDALETKNDFINRLEERLSEAELLQEIATDTLQQAPFLSLQELSQYFPRLTSITMKNVPDFSNAHYAGLGYFTGVISKTYTLADRDTIKKFEKHLSTPKFENFYEIFSDLDVNGIPAPGQPVVVADI